LVKHDDNTWHLDEFCESIAEMESRVTPIETSKKVVEVITIAHTEFVPPDALGFSVYEDAVVPSLSSSLRASAPSSSVSSSSAPRPAADVNAAPDPVAAAAE
jgi:cell wall-associated NlpC family hydrolase